jgi:DMSO/TMAO reductase YedYZ heme-binding membrane subunit
MTIRGWRLTAAIGVALLGMCASVLVAAGAGEEGVRMTIRATARSTALCFLAAFTARPLRRVWRSAATRWLLAQRRYLGVGAALSHLLHLLGIAWLAVGWPTSYAPDTVTLIFGGLGFAFLFAMGLTSSDAAVARMGRPRWQLLHRTGSCYVAFIFAISWIPDPGVGWNALYAGFLGAFLGAMGLRLAVWTKGRERRSAIA